MALTRADFDALAQRRLTTVVDLRGPMELKRDISSLQSWEGLSWHHVEVWGHIDDSNNPKDRFSIVAFYLAAIDHAGKAFAQAVNILADAEGSALFNCTVGKDRTGLLALMLLEVAGVPTEVIVDDYALTHDRIDSIRQRLLADAEKNGVAREDMASLLGATPEQLQAAISHLHNRHGGSVEYLTRYGVSQEALQRIRSKLT